jgi:transcriptional regulator with PAS, ATPase and Fis domain
MGAITENLFESEMFGHKKGAFTDAKQNRIGRFELAENGSLFLDEIANIPLSQQAKMLRVLENGEYELVGSSQTKKTNTRIISATNGNFEQLIAGDLFREDLYYRLNTIEFNVPCLKERTDDIIPLARYFIAKFTKKYNLAIKQLAEDAQHAILAYHWPGNVREMSHIIERAVLLTESEQISESDLHIKVMVSQSTVEKEIPLVTLEQAEISLVKRALKETNNHVPKAAVLLGLSKASMYRRLEKYGLSKK